MHDQNIDAAIQPVAPVPLPLRHDTILGVCQGIGEDLGVNPTWLRLAFAALLFVEPIWTVAAYLALGLLVAAARLIAPDVRAPNNDLNCGAEPAADTAAEETQSEMPLAA